LIELIGGVERDEEQDAGDKRHAIDGEDRRDRHRLRDAAGDAERR
jgi:hypothetical protein